MPRVFLSPSQQDFNQTVLGVNEAELMSMIADAVEPLLEANNITYTRAQRGATPNQAIAAANAGGYDVFLGINSNASPVPGTAYGNRNYFWETSTNGRRLAQDIADEFSRIYYEPSRATIVPNRTMDQLRRTRMPAVMSFTAFHDNEKDARWIQTNIQNIAEALVRGLARYFGLEYVAPCQHGTVPANGYDFEGNRWATICVDESALNIRREPNGPVMFTLPRGTQVIVTGPEQEGFVPIRFNFWDGWGAAQFVCICKQPSPIRPPVFPIVPPIFPEPVPPIAPIPPITPVPPIGTLPPTTPVTPIAPVPPCNCQVPPTGIIPPTMAHRARVHTNGSNLNLRSEPSMNGRIIAQMPNGSHLLVLRQAGDWLYVFWNRHLGWASKDWVRFEDAQ